MKALSDEVIKRQETIDRFKKICEGLHLSLYIEETNSEDSSKIDVIVYYKPTAEFVKRIIIFLDKLSEDWEIMMFNALVNELIDMRIIVHCSE